MSYLFFLKMDAINKLILIVEDIYSTLGAGYNEVVYHRALEVALRIEGINYQSEFVIPVFYKGFTIGNSRIDLLVGNIIIELKAVAHLNNESIVQIKNYMKQCSVSEGLVINFNQKGSGLDIRYIQNNEVYIFENGKMLQ